MEDFGAVSGTVHKADLASGILKLVISSGIPESVTAAIQRIPFGKGMAGICAVQRKPITLCNLKDSVEGIAEPKAKEIGVKGAVVIPVEKKRRIRPSARRHTGYRKRGRS